MDKKFKAWDYDAKEWWPHPFYINNGKFITDVNDEFIQADVPERFEIVQFTGLLDKNGQEIFESDVLRFSDKWEWYRSSSVSKDELENLDYEERIIVIPRDYEWLLSDEIQTYWEAVGNIYENPELLNKD